MPETSPSLQQAADWLGAASIRSQSSTRGQQGHSCWHACNRLQHAWGIVPAVTLTQGTEHGPPSVDELDLTVAGEGLGVCGQTGCVPPIVTRELAVQVVRGAGEGAQELSPLCRAVVKTCVSQMWFESGSRPAQAAATAEVVMLDEACCCISQIGSS